MRAFDKKDIRDVQEKLNSDVRDIVDHVIVSGSFIEEGSVERLRFLRNAFAQEKGVIACEFSEDADVGYLCTKNSNEQNELLIFLGPKQLKKFGFSLSSSPVLSFERVFMRLKIIGNWQRKNISVPRVVISRGSSGGGGVSCDINKLNDADLKVLTCVIDQMAKIARGEQANL